MNHLLAIASGGAIGALGRYLMSNGVHTMLGRSFPYGTLTVNVLGSFLMGILYILLLDRVSLSMEWRAALQIGLLGAFTTFSTFSIETLLLVENGEFSRAAVNIVLSVVLSLAAVWAGVMIGRQI